MPKRKEDPAHGNTRGKAPRQKISARVDIMTKARLLNWGKKTDGDGDTIDRMGEHCATTNFDPAKPFNQNPK